MDSLKDRVLDASRRFDKESLRSILTFTDLDSLQASGLSIVEILNAAIECDDERLAESCLAAGVALSKQMDADTKVFDDLFATMARAAARWDKIDILEYCLDQGVEPSTYLGGAAAFRGCERSFQLLMSRGLDINATYGYAGDALCSAALGNKLNMVNFLIENGAHLHCRSMYCRLYGPLACAAMYGSTNMLDLLISKGTAIDGSLALHQAVTFGRTDIMEYLIAAGANVNEMPQDKDSYTGADFWPGRPIHFAAEYRKLQAVKVLLDHGADPTQLNSRHQTVLEVSVHDGKSWKELEDLLRERGSSLV